MLEDKIINNNFNKVEYGTDGLRGGAIEIDPRVRDRYEESTSENIEDIYMRRKIYNDLASIYESSEYFQKYGKEAKKLEERDVSDVYYTFKEKLLMRNDYSILQIVCAIAEFFEMNYKTLYNDILSLEDKAAVIEGLQELYGLETNFSKSKKLF